MFANVVAQLSSFTEFRFDDFWKIFWGGAVFFFYVKLTIFGYKIKGKIQKNYEKSCFFKQFQSSCECCPIIFKLYVSDINTPNVFIEVK